jgi:hypothetical protein
MSVNDVVWSKKWILHVEMFSKLTTKKRKERMGIPRPVGDFGTTCNK